jgi:hypothetical protein
VSLVGKLFRAIAFWRPRPAAPADTEAREASADVVRFLSAAHHARAEESALIAAATKVARTLRIASPEGGGLPRGYAVVPHPVTGATELVKLAFQRRAPEGRGWTHDPDRPCWYVPVESPDRDQALHFADDVATGLLHEMADAAQENDRRARAAIGRLERRTRHAA